MWRIYLLMCLHLIAPGLASVPPLRPGQWSGPHAGRWCEKGNLVADLGKGVPLSQCQNACVNNKTMHNCNYVCHADQTDNRCMLYSTCSTPTCGSTSGWFTTYQYGRANSTPWDNSCSNPTPPPSPAPPGAMNNVIVSSTITAAHGAKCLDGTPPAFAIRAGVGANASRFILFLEGGGWCFSVAECAGRRQGSLGSSKSYANGGMSADVGGVMSINSTINPDFHTYTMVFVHYCDGTSFSSHRSDPITTSSGDAMWFRGKANLAAVLDELQTNHGLAAATEVILSGGSAGGLAVYYHIDYVADVVRAQSPAARVSGFPDAGYFADLRTASGALAYREMFQSADATCWNTTASGGTNDACFAQNPPGVNGTAWKCLMAEYLTDHIATPLYVMNAAFDVYQVQHILDVGCVPSTCTAAQLSAIEGYRRSYLNSSLQHLIHRAPAVGHGAYIDSCLVHEQNLDYCSGGNAHAYNCAGWLTTQVLGLTPQAAYSAWYFGRSSQNLTVDPTIAVSPHIGANPSCPWTFAR
eukprot:m.232158 g.232158  ORF g.232158 m.232158 type:complete len:525 (-) comp19271_c0_seq1:222-1796(-)